MNEYENQASDFAKKYGVKIVVLGKEYKKHFADDKYNILLCSYQSNKPLASLCIYNKNKCVLTESTIARDILAQIRESKEMLLKTQNYSFPCSLLEDYSIL